MTELPRIFVNILNRAMRTVGDAGGASSPADVPTESLTGLLARMAFYEGEWPADILEISGRHMSIGLRPKDPTHYAKTEMGSDD
jgi:hypothetical protein